VALRSARRARFLSATPRELETLLEGGVRIDLLVGSGTDEGEQYDGGLEVGVYVATRGGSGAVANGVPYPPVAPPRPIEDTYGAGDSFAAALTFALAHGEALPDALALASRAGASVITGRAVRHKSPVRCGQVGDCGLEWGQVEDAARRT
jgi:ribokinase